jgi:hypothetical protein
MPIISNNNNNNNIKIVNLWFVAILLKWVARVKIPIFVYRSLDPRLETFCKILPANGRHANTRHCKTSVYSAFLKVVIL